jgi:hypothetical protein
VEGRLLLGGNSGGETGETKGESRGTLSRRLMSGRAPTCSLQR